MNKNIFREYDIRGIVKDDLDRETVNLIGKSFGTYMIRNGLNSVGVSGDVRETTPRLITDLVEGLLSTGVSVVKLGQLPTPANYFSLYHLKLMFQLFFSLTYIIHKPFCFISNAIFQ